MSENIQAWRSEDGRVISAEQKATALRDGGASASSVLPFSIALAPTTPTVDAAVAQEPVGYVPVMLSSRDEKVIWWDKATDSKHVASRDFHGLRRLVRVMNLYSTPQPAASVGVGREASSGLLQAIDYAIEHGWPAESLARLASIREADLRRAASTQPLPRTVGAPSDAWKLVPVVPTETMVEAGYEAFGVHDCYAAMISAAPVRMVDEPVDMVLHCPVCGLQHIDAPEPCSSCADTGIAVGGAACPMCVGRSWENPPHRSHLCHGCGHVWRPADVPTNGVAAVKTTGKADHPIMSPAPQQAAAGAVQEDALEFRGFMTQGGGLYGTLPVPGLSSQDRQAFAMSRRMYLGKPIGMDEVDRLERAAIATHSTKGGGSA